VRRTCRRDATLLAELRASLPQVRIDGVTWLWTPGEDPASGRWRVDPDRARLLAPFDPWSGIAAASSCSGAGRTSSRPTRRPPSARSALRAALLWGRGRRLGQRDVPDKAHLRVGIGVIDPGMPRPALSGASTRSLADGRFLGLRPTPCRACGHAGYNSTHSEERCEARVSRPTPTAGPRLGTLKRQRRSPASHQREGHG
jgi:hypothetical protein